MTEPKTPSKTEVVAVNGIAGAVLVVGVRLIDSDPTLTPVVAAGAVVLLFAFLVYFASRPT